MPIIIPACIVVEHHDGVIVRGMVEQGVHLFFQWRIGWGRSTQKKKAYLQPVVIQIEKLMTLPDFIHGVSIDIPLLGIIVKFLCGHAIPRAVTGVSLFMISDEQKFPTFKLVHPAVEIIQVLETHFFRLSFCG